MSGNQRLPQNGRSASHPYRDTPEVVAGVLRIIRSVGRRIAEQDPPDLKQLGDLEAELATAWEVAVDGIRRSGFSDGEIGAVLGITRQAVEKRWPRSTEDDA